MSSQEDTIPEIFCVICSDMTNKEMQIDAGSDYLVTQDQEDIILQIKDEFSNYLDPNMTQDIFEMTVDKKQKMIMINKSRLKPKVSFHNANLDIESKNREIHSK